MLLRRLRRWRGVRPVSWGETPEVGEEVPPAAAGPQGWPARLTLEMQRMPLVFPSGSPCWEETRCPGIPEVPRDPGPAWERQWAWAAADAAPSVVPPPPGWAGPAPAALPPPGRPPGLAGERAALHTSRAGGRAGSRASSWPPPPLQSSLRALRSGGDNGRPAGPCTRGGRPR